MLADYEQLVADLVRDDSARLTLPEKDRAIDAMVKRYSKDRPRIKVQDVTPDDANLLPLPAAWEADFSELRTLEHPIGNNPPTLIEQGRYEFYQSPSATKIRAIDGVTVAASSVRASYTIKHVVSAAEDTIPLQDREPAACWAAAILCDQLAAFYAGGTDSTIQADSVQQEPKARQYAERAKGLRKRYHDELGIDDKRAEPAGVVVELKRPDSWNGPRILHPTLPR